MRLRRVPTSERPTSPPEPPEARALREAGEGRERRLAELFEAHRARLGRMLELRLSPDLKARVAASDVLQDTWMEVRERIDDWLETPEMPFYLWVRFLAVQRLLKARRFHLGAKRRDARREVAEPGGGPTATSAEIVDGLVAGGPSPSGAAAIGESREALLAAIEALDATDREVLALRHFEELSNADTAAVLGIHADAASKRYLRALERLRRALQPGSERGREG